MRRLRAPGIPNRTILYYPTISVPTSSWLRQALLYWDQVASIVPGDLDESAEFYTPDVQYLQSVDQFRPIDPHELFSHESGSVQRVRQFEEDFLAKLTSPLFAGYLGERSHWLLDSAIHADKISCTMYEHLASLGLAREDSSMEDWYLFERKTALLYMSVLAVHLADLDVQSTVPGTDRRDYEGFAYDASSREGYACLDIRFGDVLPIPTDDVPLADIVGFKERHRDDLLGFRMEVQQFQEKLWQSRDEGDVKDAAASFGERMEKALSDLASVLHGDRILTKAGCLKTIMNAKFTLALGMGTTVSEATQIIHIPTNLILPALAVSGAIEVGYHLIDEATQKRAALRDSPFAYLYHAQAEGLIP